MDVFKLRDDVVGGYSAYVRSFLTIADPQIKRYVEKRLEDGHLWPDSLVQLNPAFQPGATIDELVQEGVLHPETSRAFRRRKDEVPAGEPLRLHWHQEDAVRVARTGASYVLTTGTGSGKSLAYFVPIVDDALANPAPGRVKAIVVYPMNALCNSQMEELEKFLKTGYPNGRGPVTFERYTGQESPEERERIAANPPDILLTNYAMLELLMTRVDANDRAVIRAAAGLRFLVLDELHTYRGRQGADVAMLARRVRERLSATELRCIGTSATIAGEDSGEERREQVAAVASRLFGVPIAPEHVIGETLRRATTATDPNPNALRDALARPPVTPGIPYEALIEHPLAAWAELAFGVRTDASGRLQRQTPVTLAAAAAQLADETGADAAICREHLQRVLLAGYATEDPVTGRPTFNFRLHQFVSRGDTVYASLEHSADRFLTMEGQVYVPGDRDKRLFPLAFCRECGQDYAVVDRPRRDGVPEDRLAPRELEDAAPADSRERQSGYLYLDPDDEWDQAALEERFPEHWLEVGKDGRPRLKPHFRRLAPVKIAVHPDGTIDDGPDATIAWFVPTRFRFCLHCGVTYAQNQKDFTKLAELATEGRATATTVLSLGIVRGLREIADLTPTARKLLSFTDNRQDASLQAGHFNDFVQVSLLRGALYRAVQDGGSISSDEIAGRVVAAMGLPFAEYASNPNVVYQRRSDTEDALRDVVGYRVFQDLRRGWRVSAPNLEQTGQLRITYKALDEIAADEDLWRDRRSVVKDASPAERLAACKAVLDFFRRELAIKTRYLDRERQDAIKGASYANLVSPWQMDEDEKLEPAREVRQGAADVRDRERRYTATISRRTALGKYLSRRQTWNGQLRADFDEEALDGLVKDLLDVLNLTGLIEEVGQDRAAGQPLYQLNPSAMRWERGSGVPEPDLIRLSRPSAFDPRVNAYFAELYGRIGLTLRGMEAREHTAQVPSDKRQEREEAFREGSLAVLYCSPTMELGVDIADLNAVNMRNVPPTPANYAQRSGRAGRAGQPALVVTYCSSFSPHDQYFFRRQPRMVAGAITPPRIDLANEDLLRSHFQAVWLAETGQDLGSSLKDILDLSRPEEKLPLQESFRHGLASGHAKRRARARCLALLDELEPELRGVTWCTPAWLDDVIERAPANFDQACNRWRQLYLSAQKQRDQQHAIMSDHSISRDSRDEAERLRREAETQLKILVDEGASQSDFYSYRYFASEGFLPGYNFPRLPLSAYLPGRYQHKGVDDFVSRARFVAISEFGPRNIVYFEGSRFRIEKVILPPRDAETGSLTTTAKVCADCGYGHVGLDANDELCHGCGAKLDGGRFFSNLFRMQNVSTRRVDRITSDEEERMRFGYDLLSSYQYARDVDERPILTHAHYVNDGEEVANAIYAPTATLWRINLGWRRRKNQAELGFRLNLENGRWSKKDPETEAAAQNGDEDTPEQGPFAAVVPFVEDRRNALILCFAADHDADTMVSLLYALKRGIATRFQLEDSELDGELVPDHTHPTRILLYESAEGGAGVLSRLAQEPRALAEAARAALEVCHFDPETGEDRRAAPDALNDCEAACYACLLSYTNQRFHQKLDRRLVRDVLRRLANAVAETSGAPEPRGQARERLLARCDSHLERRFVAFLDERGYRLPDDAQRLIPDFGTRPDFFYKTGQTCVYVDGPYHRYPERRARDAETTSRLEDGGYTVVRFAEPEEWDAVLRDYAWIFGEGRD